jgi:hypothetical protein
METEKLTRSWEQHEAAWLRDYLVSGVEDPRLNLQSILSRHFLLRAATGERFAALMDQEFRFAAVMDWLDRVAKLPHDPEARNATLHALRKGADNAEGLEIPLFVLQAFTSLPTSVCGCDVPNYIESFLYGEEIGKDTSQAEGSVLNTFLSAWTMALGMQFPMFGGPCPELPMGSAVNVPPSPSRLAVIEPACGSANDYRFLQKFGIAPLLDYTGFDLCEKNIENARALYPHVRFERGNVFDISAPARAFDFCVVFDLFEHLSPPGLEQAVSEICRVTRLGICVGFFQMDEIPEHRVRPVDEYHWNLLSLTRMRELFARLGFTGQAVHIGTLLHRHVGCPYTHNPNAYTFVLSRG